MVAIHFLSCGTELGPDSTQPATVMNPGDEQATEQALKPGARPREISTPSGDLTVRQERGWIRFEGVAIARSTRRSDAVILGYRDQNAEFLASDIELDGTSILLREGVVPLSANGRDFPQVSGGATTNTACSCSQCVFFLELCCIPSQFVVGLCFGAWGCESWPGCGVPSYP